MKLAGIPVAVEAFHSVVFFFCFLALGPEAAAAAP